MRKVINSIPIIMFLVVLLFTNIIGICLLVWGPISYWKVSYIFSGVSLPDLYMSDVLNLVAVVFVPIVFLVASFYIGRKLAQKFINRKVIRADKTDKACAYDTSKWVSYVSVVVSFALILYLLIRLFSFLTLKDAAAWLSNNEFYAMRMKVMSKLSFEEFVIIYSILPTVLALSYWKGRGKRLLLFVIEVLLYLIINIYIFQKRPLIVGLLLIGIVIMLNYLEKINNWNLKKIVAIGMGSAVILYCIYSLGIVLNATKQDTIQEYNITTEKITEDQISEVAAKANVSVAASTNVENSSNSLNSPNSPNTSVEKEKPFRIFELEGASLHLSSFQFTQLMAAVGFLNRTAYATIVDVAIFPKVYDYYPLDLGLDMLGIGNPPDENLVAAMIMYPSMENPGSTPVPYYITLYTQGGIIVAIIGSILVGFCLGFSWMLALTRKHVLNYVFGAWICVFAVMISMNSGRNALFASDGAVWPVFALGCMALCSWLCTKFADLRKNKKSDKEMSI